MTRLCAAANIVMFFCVLCVPTTNASCFGAPTEVYWSSYHDIWYAGDYVDTTSDPISVLGDSWTDYVEETVDQGDCPPTCSYSVQTISTFTGNNQWMPNIGGELAFRQIAAGESGTVVGIDPSGTVSMLDALNQVWHALPGSFDASAMVTTGDYNNIYILQDSVLFHYNIGGYWEQLSDASSIIEISTAGNGIVYGHDNGGQVYEWDDYIGGWNASAFPALYGMTQFSIAPNDVGNAIGADSPATYALSGGAIYYLLYGSPWQWSYLPTPFTPVEVRASKNAAIAIDTNGQIWTLTALSGTEYPNGSGGWYTVLSANWDAGPSLPAGTTHLAAGGPADVYGYGTSGGVWRLFPNASVQLAWGDYGSDYLYTGSGEFAAIPGWLPEDWDFMASGSAQVTEQCRGAISTILATAWAFSEKEGGKPGSGPTYFCDRMNTFPIGDACGYVCSDVLTGDELLVEWPFKGKLVAECNVPANIHSCPSEINAHKIFQINGVSKLAIDQCTT